MVQAKGTVITAETLEVVNAALFCGSPIENGIALRRIATGNAPAGNPVAFVKTIAEGVPSAGVTIAQEVVIQKLPVPLIPVHVHVAMLEGAPNSITLFAKGTALGV